MAKVRLSGIGKKFGAVEVIRDLNLEVAEGEFCALLGPSGCGKSTLLRMIAGLEDVTEGQIYFDDENVTEELPTERGIAMVFQSYALYPHMTVEQNIGFALRVAGAPKEEAATRIAKAASLLGLSELMQRKPAQLSGGQRQRVAIGRALVREPRVFLFDEPLSNLDALLRLQMRVEIAKLHKQLKVTMIYVTHDQVEAMTLADRIVVLDKGIVSQIGRPLDLYHRPDNKFVASFIGAPTMNFVPARFVGLRGGEANFDIGEIGKAVCRLGNGNMVSSSSEVELGVRPEHVSLIDPNSRGANLKGNVLLVERLGNATIVHVETAIGPIVFQDGENEKLAFGDKVGLRFDPDRIHVFGRDGKVM
jgi:ABC-type sugar transport system ATPase subunit